MQVILIKNIKGLGKGGDVIRVKDGYARNYLIPQGFAAEASSINKKQMEHQKRQINEKILKETQDAKLIAERIANTSVTISRLVGENERLFGSVKEKDIQEVLREEGIMVQRSQIELEEPIKALGVYEVPVNLYNEINATLKVWVVAK